MQEDALKIEAERARKTNIILFSIFLFIAAGIVIGVGIFKAQHTFSQEKWLRDVEHRYQMVDSLLEEYQLIGMSEAEVVGLLGDEEGGAQTSFKRSKAYYPPEDTLVYYLGVEYMDAMWLVISLENGVAADYCIDQS